MITYVINAISSVNHMLKLYFITWLKYVNHVLAWFIDYSYFIILYYLVITYNLLCVDDDITGMKCYKAIFQLSVHFRTS